MARDPRTLLFDAIEAGRRITRFVAGKTFGNYSQDELLRAGVERQFEIMGEALNRLRRLDAKLLDSVREHEKVIAFRNLLIHGYAEIDHAVVWSVVIEKLPLLMQDMDRLLDRLGRD